MIAIAPTSYGTEVFEQTAEAFETMLPAIRRVACFAFRHVPHRRREELIGDVVALAYTAYAGLVRRGMSDVIYPTVLANFSIKQVKGGREVGVRQNVNDVLSQYSQRQRGFSVQSLHHQDASGRWEDLVVEDKRSTPADVAAFRIDFQSWLSRLDRRRRALALRLATGESAKDAASYFRVSQARVSQCRKELKASWEALQGESAGVVAAA